MPPRMPVRRRRVLLVGFAGHQGREYLGPVREQAEVVGGVEVRAEAAELARSAGFPCFGSVGEALREAEFDTALVTVPHHAHFAVCEELLRNGKHVVKEKPFAVTVAEAEHLVSLAAAVDRGVLTLLQRNFNPVFAFAREQLGRIGSPYWFSYDYHLALGRATSGWRASRDQALGGVLLDMGYHLIDVLAGLFPPPSRVEAVFTHRYAEMRDRRLEDLVCLLCGYPSATLAGSLRVSRHHYEKTERLLVLGTAGALSVEPDRALLHLPGDPPPVRFLRPGTKADMVRAMFSEYFGRLDDRAYRSAHLGRQLSTVRTIEAAYRGRAGAGAAATVPRPAAAPVPPRTPTPGEGNGRP